MKSYFGVHQSELPSREANRTLLENLKDSATNDRPSVPGHVIAKVYSEDDAGPVSLGRLDRCALFDKRSSGCAPA